VGKAIVTSLRNSRVVRLATALSLIGGATAVGIATSTGTSSAATTITSDDGSYVTAVTPVDSTMYDLSIFSAAMKTTLHARVIVPTNYFTNTTATYPSLYLLSGSGDNTDWQDWSLASPIESFMAGRNVLTVMPQGGNAGWYTNWYGTSKVFTAAKPAWDTFQNLELPQLMNRAYRANNVNAIAGISEAGVGVFDYPALHPGLWKAAASFSGMLDTQSLGSVATVALSENRAADNTAGPWGDSILNSSVWAAHNPAKLVSAFKASGATLWLASGNGQPGPGDGAFAWDSYIYEQNALSQAKTMATAATAAGIKVTTDFYGNGMHNWPSWVRAFPNAWSTTLAPALGVS
jgi:diacylglycerol O-acyltransferase/trehalose O-mycolyltransferase